MTEAKHAIEAEQPAAWYAPLKLFSAMVQNYITTWYLLAVAIGMLFTYKRYAQFGINIFDYADVFDFLIAPFSDLKILFFTLVALAFPVLMLLVNRFVWKNKRLASLRARHGFSPKSYLLVVLIICYVYVAANYYAAVAAAEIVHQAPVQIIYQNNEKLQGQLIGKTGDVVFLLINEKVSVVPLNSAVVQMQLPSN
ncbi:hypothetical protein GC194_06975 [bacterium]|nr:hypothetical protein [bacterium]